MMKRKEMTELCRNASTDVRHHGEFRRKMRLLLPSSGARKLNGTALIENRTVLTQLFTLTTQALKQLTKEY